MVLGLKLSDRQTDTYEDTMKSQYSCKSAQKLELEMRCWMHKYRLFDTHEEICKGRKVIDKDAGTSSKDIADPSYANC